jgi:hypothetical protein
MNAFPPPRRGRPTLAERSAASGHGSAGRQAQQAGEQAAEWAGQKAGEQEGEAGGERAGRRTTGRTSRTAPSPTPKHCWVDDPRWPGRRPALLVKWSRAERGWWGLVVLVVDDDQPISEWVAGTALTSA